jgi:LacI family transcriptional regulator
MAKVTLKKVAQKSGFSVSTVSRALRNHPKISQKTQKKVRTIYENLRVNIDANRSNSNGHSILGIFMPADKVNKAPGDFIPRQLEALQEVAMAHDYNLMVGAYGDDGTKEQIIKDKVVDGVILVRTHTDDSIYKKLQQKNIPFIALHRLLLDSCYNYIGVDDHEGGVCAVEHLISRGHKEIAFASGPVDVSPIKEKLNGYMDALRKHNLKIRTNWILENKNGSAESDGLQLGLNLLSLNPRPKAVFAATDEIAFGILSAAQQKNINVPKDLAVVGFDNQPRAALCTPPLTTISVPWKQMINMAIESLIQLIENRPWVEQVQIKLKTKLEIRLST